jgi:hypothetical protein
MAVILKVSSVAMPKHFYCDYFLLFSFGFSWYRFFRVIGPSLTDALIYVFMVYVTALSDMESMYDVEW